MLNSEHFGPRLREIRESQGLTQSELAEKAKMTRGGIAQLEIGRNQPTWETAIALANALGVTCEAFTVKPTQPVEPRGPGRPPKAPAKPRKPKT